MRVKFEYKRETNKIMKKQSETVNYIYTDFINLFEEKKTNSESLNKNVKKFDDFYKLKSITSYEPVNVEMKILFFDVSLNEVPAGISKADIHLLFTTDIFDVKNVREHKIKIDFDVYDQDLNFVYDYIDEIVKQKAKDENYDGVVIEGYHVNKNIRNKSISEVRQNIAEEIYRLNDLRYG